MKHLKNFIFGLMAIAFFACDSDEEPAQPQDDGMVYFPLKKGMHHLYDVEEILYALGKPDTFVYELKTVVADSFLNAENKYTYIIHRSKRNPNETTWTTMATWSARVNMAEAVVSERNISFVVLHFPIQEGKEWNGNAYNTLINPTTNKPEDVYTIEKAKTPFMVNNTTFEDCVLVKQEDNQEFIVYFDKRKEVYARSVGLIYKEKTELSYCTDQQQNCIGKQIVESGIIYKQVLKEYGVE